MTTAARTSFIRSLIVQYRVIGAILRREFITRYGRYNIGFFWMFGEPMLFTTGVAILWRYIDHRNMYIRGNISCISFALTGYSTVMLWRNGVGRCLKAVEPNMSLLYHRNVKVFDLMAARLILEVAGGTISLVVLMSFCVLMGWIAPPYDILTMIYGWLLLAWYSVGLGFIVGAISEFSDTFERLWHVFMYLYLAVSGLFFLVEWLPGWVRKYAMLVPTINLTEMIRSGYYGNLIHAYYDAPYMAMVDLVLLLLGLALVNIASRHVEPE